MKRMKTRNYWKPAGLLALAVPMFAAALTGSAGAQNSIELGPVTGNAARGKQLYYNYTCYGCHGYNGQTGRQSLIAGNDQILANEANFTHFLRLRADYAPVVPAEPMPNYSKKTLSDADAKDIYAYIRTFKLDAPDVDKVPALKTIVQSAERKPKMPSKHR